MMSPNELLIENVKIVLGLAPQVPVTAVPSYADLADAYRCAIIIQCHNGLAPVGSVISLSQAKTVGGGSAKALALGTVPGPTAWSAINTGPSGNTDTLTSLAVVANTFTTSNTASIDNIYVIEVQANDLDVNNNFTCVTVNVGNTTNETVSVTYVLYPSKFGETPANAPTGQSSD
jgi:hypothetical protein